MIMGPLLIGIYVLVLASFVGFEVITKVPPTLHTPLMSGVQRHFGGITLVGAIIYDRAERGRDPSSATILGVPAPWPVRHDQRGWRITWSPIACSTCSGKKG